jgi:hypothetical protein
VVKLVFFFIFSSAGAICNCIYDDVYLWGFVGGRCLAVAGVKHLEIDLLESLGAYRVHGGPQVLVCEGAFSKARKKPQEGEIG